jgi:hypothetical protein
LSAARPAQPGARSTENPRRAQITAKRALTIVFALGGAACGPGHRSCHFGPEHAIFESHGSGFDDIALAFHDGRAVALFSEPLGLYARELDRQGLPRSRVARLGPRCDAGLAAADGGDRNWLACARRGDGGEPGAVALGTLGPALDLTAVASFGPVGPSSHGVALAAHGGDAALAWQDALLGDARLRVARWPGTEASLASDPSWYAERPALALDGARTLLAWGESRELSRRYESRVRYTELRQPQNNVGSTLVSGRDPAPSPELVAGQGGVWLAFRDRRKGARRTGLYLTRLGPDGRRIGELMRAGRADGVGRPVVRACLGGLVAATPRTFAGDYFVGVVRIDPSLRGLSGEQQFYEDSHEFAQVAASCLGDRALLLIAERARLGRSGAALRSVSFSCN